MVHQFWWGDTADTKKLHLKAWDVLCKPKCSGGLGFWRFRDINVAMITKLGWRLCTDTTRPWVQLVKSKYLRGRRLLDLQQTTQAASWIWNGIHNCYGSLRNGLCICIGQNSSSRIYEDLWLPGWPTYIMPTEIRPKEGLFFVRDLMNMDRTAWDTAIIQASFPPDICKSILSIPINTREQDVFVWALSKSGAFTVWSSYRLNNRCIFGELSVSDKQKWAGVWHSNLHARHKFII